MADSVKWSLLSVLLALGMLAICNGSMWCLEPRWVFQPELSYKVGIETPKYGGPLACNNSLVEVVQRHPVSFQLDEQVRRETELHNDSGLWLICKAYINILLV